MVFEDNVNSLASIYTIRLKGIAYILDLKENTISKSRLSIKRKNGCGRPCGCGKTFYKLTTRIKQFLQSNSRPKVFSPLRMNSGPTGFPVIFGHMPLA